MALESLVIQFIFVSRVTIKVCLIRFLLNRLGMADPAIESASLNARIIYPGEVTLLTRAPCDAREEESRASQVHLGRIDIHFRYRYGLPMAG